MRVNEGQLFSPVQHGSIDYGFYGYDFKQSYFIVLAVLEYFGRLTVIVVEQTFMKSIHSINLMWNQACETLERADRLQRQFFRLGQIGQIAAWEPPIDMFESDSELLIRMALPDVNREDFEIQLEASALRLSGRRSLPKEAKQRVIRRLEIPYGPMERYITLPPGRFRLAAHTYNNGCLEIHLHRLNESE